MSLFLNSCQQSDADPVDVSFIRAWTAVGDDGIIGTASFYDGRVAMTEDSLYNQWDDCFLWIGSEVTPLPSGQAETFNFVLTVEKEQTYYFAIKAMDNAGNWSLISNIYSEYIPDDVAPSAIVDLH